MAVTAQILPAEDAGPQASSMDRKSENDAENPKSKIQDPKSELPSAGEILAQARAALPTEPLLIRGQILTGGRIGKLGRACYLDMFMEFGEDPAMICCQLCDAFGTPFEKMNITVGEDCAAEFEYETGTPLKPAVAPSAGESVLETDLAWNDLCLLFLWRAGGRTVRLENLRGRDCYVIEFAGDAAPIENRKSKIENKTFVWIDTQMMVPLQMEELDRENKPRRRMEVKSIKQISDQWMVKNMEIRSYPSKHHTLIRIDDVIIRPLR